MSCILNIETSTPVCSIAVSADSKIIFEKISFDGPSHAALLGVYVEEAIKEIKKNSLPLDAVAVSSGPGSYTGLRIGVSLAKGLCFGYDIPLIAIPTLEIMAKQAISDIRDEELLYCAMLDARRMEVYDAIYNSKLEVIRQTTADVITPETFESLLKTNRLCFFGNGAGKCKEIIHSTNAMFIEDVHPLATNMIDLSEKAFQKGDFVNVAYFEPFYLKEFVATIAKNKVLGNS